MSDTSGRTWLTPLAEYDPETCSWRTSGAMFPSAWPTSSQTCPAWGMTRGGELFELPMPVLPTVEPGSSSLLPTPVVNDMGAGKTPEAWDAWTERMRSAHGNGNGHGASLSIEVARLLPTPRTTDSNGAGEHGTGGPDLRTAVSLLPTPRATDGEKGGPNQRGSSGDLMLPSAVCQLLPTPTVMDSKASGGSTPSDVTLTDAVVRTSLGARTNPRFDAGSASSDDQLPGQLSLDVPESA